MIYLLVFLMLSLLAFRYDICEKTKGRERWYYSVMMLLILIAGLRYRVGIDTPNYIFHFYYDIPVLSKLDAEDLSIGKKPLWILLNSFVKTIGGRFYFVQLIQTTFVNVLIFKYIKRHSRYLFTCVLFYFVTLYLSYNMETMKASMSIVVCLYANDYILEKKWVHGYILYTVGVLFHPQAIVIMLLPMFLSLKFNKWFLLAAVILYFIGLEIQSILGDYLMLFEFDDAIYDKASGVVANDKHSGQTHNLNFVIMNVLSYIVYTIVSFFYVKKQNSQSNLLRFEPFLVLYVCFYIIGINVGISYRFSMYFGLYFVFFISELFMLLVKKRDSLSAGMNLAKAVAVIMPFVALIGNSRRHDAYRYIPYSSVIEKKIDKTREQERFSIHPYGPSASKNEY